jgi:hypothetical protein
MAAYVAIISKDPEGFRVSFPDLPGCTAAATSLDQAGRLAPRLLAERLAGLGSPPPAMSLDQARRSPAAKEALAFLLAPRDEAPDRAVRLNITLPRSLVGRVDEFAASRGLSRSAFLAQAAARALADPAA